MAEALGMPNARPFTLKGASARRPIFLIARWFLEDLLEGAGLYLDELDIDLYDWADFGGKEAIGFTTAELNTFVEKTGLMVSKYTASGIKNVSWVWLKQAGRKKRTEEDDGLKVPPAVRALFKPLTKRAAFAAHITDAWNGRSSGTFAGIAERIIVPVVKKNVVLSVPHGAPTKYRPDGDFQIYIWSSPFLSEVQGTHHIPERVLGVRNDMFDGAFGDPRDAQAAATLPHIILRDGKYAFATVLPNALYIHHDVVHYGNDNEFTLFAKILAEAGKVLGSAKSWKDAIAASARIEKERIEQAYAELVTKCVKPRMHRKNASLEEARKTALTLREQYFAAEREVLAYENDPPQTEDKVAKRFVAEIERLKSGKVTDIESAELSASGEFILNTGIMRVRNPQDGKLYELGRFRVTINIMTGRLMSIVNKDRQPIVEGRTCHSPHVFNEGGSICLGNISREVQAYLAHFEVEAVASLITAFLQSCANDHGYVLRVKNFPLAKESAEPALRKAS